MKATLKVPIFFKSPSGRNGALIRTRHLSYSRHVLPLVIVPALMLCFYSALAFLQASTNSPGRLEQTAMVSNVTSTVVTSAAAIWTLCPSATPPSLICSEGMAQILLLVTARLSAYLLYITLVISTISKCCESLGTRTQVVPWCAC